MDIQDVCPEHIINEYSRKLKVCGHPVRIKLLCVISRQDDRCVTSLWTSVGASQPVISQHLAVLKEHGVVDSIIQGNRRIYSIRDDFIRDIIAKMLEDAESPNEKLAEPLQRRTEAAARATPNETGKVAEPLPIISPQRGGFAAAPAGSENG